MFLKSSSKLFGVAVVIILPLLAIAESLIYQHDFAASAVSQLGGTATDIGNGTWQNTNGDNASSFRTDGSVVASSAASGIWLPVAIEQGNIYTLSANVDLSAGDWLSLGYAQNKDAAAFYGSAGYGTVIVKDGFAKAFSGAGTGGDQGVFFGAGAGVQQLKIVLDATDLDSTKWKMKFFEADELVAGPVEVANGNYRDIAYVGFTTANASSTGSISNFSLTVLSESSTIYKDDFSGNLTTDLLGTEADVGGGIWTSSGSSASFKADGSVIAGSAASGIWLPLSVEQGNIYTLSADVDQTAGNWLSLGYAQNNEDAAFFSSAGYGTVLVNSSFAKAFSGVGTGGDQGVFVGAGAGVQQIKIVLDATDLDSANWTMEFFEAGVSVAGPISAAIGDYGDIAYVGFTTANASSTGTISNFELMVNDTEPPSPNTAGFEVLPVAMNDTTVRMLATEGSDLSGVVEYLFVETTGNPGATGSSWQSSPYYEDTGLTPGLQYSYRVVMRDAWGNVGFASAPATVTPGIATSVVAQQSGAWSAPATWGGSRPGPEDDVTIPMGVSVTLDGDQECGSLTVMGQLTANPNADCSLSSDWVMVMGANAIFEVGSDAVRYPHNFTLTLKGLKIEEFDDHMGSKFLAAMNGGKIHLHGPDRVSWTKLSATALAGSTTITLDDVVDWVAGERIVITSTDTDWEHAEERTIASVSGDGLTVTLSEPLAYKHTGVTETHTRPTDNKSWSIDLKAEVGLLSRDVKIQGDIFSDMDNFGGHTMAMGFKEESGVIVNQGSMVPGAFYADGVEFYRMGQTKKMGRYPVHWHMLADQAQGQYVRNSSIHHSFSRAVTIHGTDYITIEDNFCYDHIGHGIFLENGVERFNVIRENVVLLTRRPAPGDELTPSDNELDEFRNRTPASFWITNPNNTIQGNIVAGTEGTGYWFIFPKTPLEPAGLLTYYSAALPSKEPLGSFDRNTAHSCMNGLDINDQLRAADHSIITNAAWDNNGPFYFNDCAWFSNDIALYAGIGGRKANVVYNNHKFADNVNCIVFATYHTVQESMLIADSGHGNLLGEAPTMYWVYDGAGEMKDNHMVGWDGGNATLFFQQGASIKHPNHRFSGFTWDHAGFPRNMHTRDYDALPPAGVITSTGHGDSNPMVWGQVIYDIDGSVAGLPGGAVITDHPFMVTGSEATTPPNWDGNLISNHRFAHLRCKYSNSAGNPPSVSVERTKIGTKTEGFAYHKEYALQSARKFHQLPLIVNNDFLYTYSYELLPAGNEIQLSFDDTEVGDSVLLCFKHFGQLDQLSVTGTAHGSLVSLQASNSTGYYVEPNGDLYIRPVSTQLYDNLLTVTWSGSLSLPVLDADMDGISDMIELENGTDPFGLPVALAQSVVLNEDTSLAITLSGTDPENDPLTFEVTTQPVYGTLTGNAPNLTYTPDANFNGSDSFTFSVKDGSLENSATVSITVAAQNDNPVFSEETITGTNAIVGQTYTGNLSAQDIDGDSLVYSILSGPSWLTVASDGSLSGIPQVIDVGSNTWTVEVSDGNGGADQATLEIEVVEETSPAIRVTEYYLSTEDLPTTNDFTGTSFMLTLDQDLADDYFILVRGSRTGSGTSMPSNDYVRVSAVPGGKGALPDSGATSQIELKRFDDDRDWEGVVTVIECGISTSDSGFRLVDVLEVDMNANTLSGTVNSAAWTDVNQVVPFGGYRGGGVEMHARPSSRYQGTSCYTRLHPSGSNTLNWSRDGGGETLLGATMTVFLVEWGSDWTVQHVDVTGSAGGNGADAASEYTTAPISSVSRANTWLWATGTRADSGIGDSAESCLVTIGNGVTVNSSESTVAIGSEYPDAYHFDIYVMTHPDIAVDHRFKADGHSDREDLAVTVNTVAGDERFGWLYNGCNGIGDTFPRPRMWSRYTSDDVITISRGHKNQPFPAWVQGIDLSGLNQ